jgi:uncharacterized protein involved in exopolysaccharide biosynthesis
MPEPFDPIEYLRYLGERWKFAAATIAAAVILTAVACWLAPNRYTATATLVIEPPGSNDPRAATAVSTVYLESLKTYEDFAGSDSLFARAVEKFHLLPAAGAPTIEGFKRSVLRVNKRKETKLLEISVTLPDPRQAQAVAQYIAAETVELNRSLAKSGEGEARAAVDTQLEKAHADLDRARSEQAAAEASGSEDAIQEELRSLADVRARTSEQVISANAMLAELEAREKTLAPAKSSGEELDSVRGEITSTRARAAALNAERAALDRESAAKIAALAALRARAGRASDQLRVARAAFEALAEKANDFAASAGMRTEQMRIVDPGIVPQQPSFPKPVLFIGAALVIGAALSLAYLSLQFGLSRQRARSIPTELKVARGGGR